MKQYQIALFVLAALGTGCAATPAAKHSAPMAMSDTKECPDCAKMKKDPQAMEKMKSDCMAMMMSMNMSPSTQPATTQPDAHAEHHH